MGNDFSKKPASFDDNDVPKRQTYLFSHAADGKKINKKIFMEDEIIKLPNNGSCSSPNVFTQGRQGLHRLKNLRQITAA